MLIEPILGYKSTWRILELLFETPRKRLSRKSIFNHTFLGNAPLSRGLNRLTAAGILIKEKEGKKEFYYVNLGNEFTLLIKELWEKERKDLRYLDYDTKAILSEFVRKVLEINPVDNIILFGSHAKGTASIRSDVDVAVIREVNELEVTRIVSHLEEKFKKEIQVHYLKKLDKSKLAKEIERDGIGLLR